MDDGSGLADRRHDLLERLAERITNEVPGVVSVTYGIATKPPSTMEVV
ncbi:MAG: hypothetical protein C5617_001125 [ANME-2 cluster archaeon]|nr:MAG: hypothetical protein C5617_001125 [ANME-2 cluster archaeon]